MASLAAAAAFKSGDFEAAEQGYTEVLAGAGDADARAAALANRAQCRLRLGLFEEGREDAATARALAPENPKAWYRLGLCEARLARLTEAEAALGQALELRPGDPAVSAALTAVRRRQAEGRGRYAWEEVWSQYLISAQLVYQQAQKEAGTGDAAAPTPAGQSLAAAMDEVDGLVLASLGVEPYVGPVRIGLSEGRGRGLFVTEDVPAGRLLLCCHALVTGMHQDLPGRLASCARRSPEIEEFLRGMSQGTAESETEVPSLSPAQLAAPRRLLRPPVSTVEGPEGSAGSHEEGLSSEDLETVMVFNQFSLPMVNPNAAPIEVTNDPGRSGVWLLPSFVNHACLPNVQRTTVLDCLFLRAGRDLKAGDELFDCYIETLQPLARRSSSLSTYGIKSCGCDRCLFEEAVVGDESGQADVQAVLEQVAAGATCGGEQAEIADKTEAAATQAEVVMAQALDRALAAGAAGKLGRLRPLRWLPLPETPISAHRMAMLRGNFERFADAAEEASFARQEVLLAVLLGSLSNVLRAFAISLRGLNRFIDAAAAWSRVLDAVEQVIPSSELTANVATENLSAKLLAFHLDFRKAAKQELRRSLQRSNEAYSGGVVAWRVLSKLMFSAPVLEGAGPEWEDMQKGMPRLARGSPEEGYDPKALTLRPAPSPAPPQARGPSFEDLLRQKARQQDQPRSCKSPSADTALASAAGTSAGYGGSSPAVPTTTATTTTPTAKQQQQQQQQPAAAPSPAASCEVTCTPDPDGGPAWVTAVVSLPGLASAAEASLEVSELELRVESLQADCPHIVCTKLPLPVDPSTSAAKWSRRSQQLTIRLRAV